MSKTYGYCRASTKKQIDSPDVQKDQIKKYAEYQRLGDVTFFVDAAQSGKIGWDERDAGKELFKQIRVGDHVIVSRLDRAFRRLADCAEVLERFKRQGVKLHITNMLGGAIDLSSPMGVFLIHILASFAELERAFISERTKDGLAKRKNAGVRYTNYAGYGFKWEKRTINGRVAKVLVQDAEERNVMRSILQWRLQDEPLSWKQISDHLNFTLELKTRNGFLWDPNRVRRTCKAELKLRLQDQSCNDVSPTTRQPA
jgi:DNA invertase Pin-like site-specific DNA recombinase